MLLFLFVVDDDEDDDDDDEDDDDVFFLAVSKLEIFLTDCNVFHFTFVVRI